MRLLPLIVMMTLAGPVRAATLQATGEAGLLGEWELAATLDTSDAGGPRTFSGVVHLSHIGICSIDGPEEKSGVMALTISRWTGAFSGTVAMDGVVCSFRVPADAGRKGVLACPDRREVPLLLFVQ